MKKLCPMCQLGPKVSLGILVSSRLGFVHMKLLVECRFGSKMFDFGVFGCPYLAGEWSDCLESGGKVFFGL